PLVVKLVTHCYNPTNDQATFRQPFVDLGAFLENEPARDSILDGRVKSYVADWPSSASFGPAFKKLLGSYLASALGLSSLSETLLESARDSSALSDHYLNDAVQKIVDDVTVFGQYLLPNA